MAAQSNVNLEKCDFSPDFHSPTGFVKSTTNGRNRDKSVLIHANVLYKVLQYA